MQYCYWFKNRNAAHRLKQQAAQHHGDLERVGLLFLQVQNFPHRNGLVN